MRIKKCDGEEKQVISTADISFYNVFAPVITGFVNWVMNKAIEDGRKRLYFLARDGYLMYRAAIRLEMHRKTGLEMRYLKVSRFSVRSAEYAFTGKEALDTLFVGGIDISLRKIFRRALLKDVEIDEIAGLIGYGDHLDEPLTYTEIIRIKELFTDTSKGENMATQKLITYLTEHCEKAYGNTTAYFRQEGLMDDVPYALVDSGWIGTLQRSIQRVVRKAEGSERMLKGYYFGLYERPKDAEHWQYEAYYFDSILGLNDGNSFSLKKMMQFCRHLERKVYFSNCLFEAVCSAPDGMTTGYERVGGKVVALCDVNGNPNKEQIRRFDRLLPIYLNGYIANSSIHPEKENEKSLRRLMAYPTMEEAESLGSLLFCDDVMDKGQTYIAAKLTKEEKRNLRFYRRILIKCGWLKGTLTERAWQEGSIRLSGKGCGLALFHERVYKYFVYLRKC